VAKARHEKRQSVQRCTAFYRTMRFFAPTRHGPDLLVVFECNWPIGFASGPFTRLSAV
jgi:hypothetical protein